MKKTLLCAASLSALALLSLGLPAKASAATVTKAPGTKTVNIYAKVSAKGASKKVTTTSAFKYSKIQATASKKTKSGVYDYIYVNGRPVGWVKESWFTRNKISAASDVYRVKGDNNFNYKDALNYVADSHGTVVDPDSGAIKASYKNGKLTYSYGKIKKTVNVHWTSNPNTAVKASYDQGDFKLMKGPKESASTGKHTGTSAKWNAAHHYAPETTSNSWTSGGLTLRTNLWEPRNLSMAGNGWQQVGPVEEGLGVNGGWAYSTWYRNSGASDVKNAKGNLVAFNLPKLNKYTVQYLAPAAYLYKRLNFGTFRKYCANIKVSPYMKLGHGQSIGVSKNYIYVLANYNKINNGDNAEEILQIRRSDLQINKMWTIRIKTASGTPRYFHNATFSGDDTMYGLFHNGRGWYEYWTLKLVDNAWKVVKVTGTKGNFVKQVAGKSPVQGFTYGNGNFYVAFNNMIFKVKADGTYQKTWKHVTNRENEGLTYSGSTFYAQLAQRGEILSGKW